MIDDQAARFRQLGYSIAEALLDSPRARGYVRELVLQILLEHERISQRGLIESFCEHCYDRGLWLKVDEKGRMTCDNYPSMPVRWKDFYEAHYSAIKAHIIELDRYHQMPWRANEQTSSKPAATSGTGPAVPTAPPAKPGGQQPARSAAPTANGQKIASTPTSTQRPVDKPPMSHPR